MARIVDGTIVFDDGTPMMGQQPITGKRLIEVLQLLPQLIPAIGMAGFPTRGGGAGGFVASGGGGGGSQGTPTAGAPGATGTSGYSGYSGSSTGTSGFSGYSGSGGPGASGFSGYSGVGGPGASGFSGYSGVGGPGTSGFSGYSGATSVSGFSGYSGVGGAGASGFSGYSGTNGTFTPEAATFVVHPTPGVGDFTTIQAALTALPASGGYILVREGTYAIATTNTVPDKPVVIRGCGDATVIDLGANAIAAFTIPNGLTAQREYSFEYLKVIGTSIANQRFLSIEDANAFGQPTIKSIRTEGIQIPIDIVDADENVLTPLFIGVYDSWFVPIADGSSILCNSNGNALLMSASFFNTKFIVDDFNTIGGTLDGDSFGNIDYAFYDCDLSLTGEDAFSTIHAERCRIFNFSGTPQILFVSGNFISDDYAPASAFINCNVLGIWIDNTSSSQGLLISGGWWTNDRIETGVTNGQSEATGVTFRADGNSAATFPVSGGITAFIVQVAEDFRIIGCTFSFTSITLTAYIYGGSDLVIVGCAFRAVTGASTAGIRLNGVNNFVHHCDFDQNNWGAPPILEVAPADRNVYNDNLGLNGNSTGTGVASVFVGVRNTFNGLSQLQATAATTDAFVTVTTQLATSGVQGIATIKNTGANGMNVRETGVDQFGTTNTTTTVVAAGADLRLDPTVNIGTARPPYKSYMIEVQSQVAGNATTYVLRLGMNGEVSA